MSSKARARSQLKLDCARVSIHRVALPQTPCQEPRTNAQAHLVKLASRFVPSAWKPLLNPGSELARTSRDLVFLAPAASAD